MDTDPYGIAPRIAAGPAGRITAYTAAVVTGPILGVWVSAMVGPLPLFDGVRAALFPPATSIAVAPVTAPPIPPAGTWTLPEPERSSVQVGAPTPTRTVPAPAPPVTASPVPAAPTTTSPDPSEGGQGGGDDPTTETTTTEEPSSAAEDPEPPPSTTADRGPADEPPGAARLP